MGLGVQAREWDVEVQGGHTRLALSRGPEPAHHRQLSTSGFLCPHSLALAWLPLWEGTFSRFCPSQPRGSSPSPPRGWLRRNSIRPAGANTARPPTWGASAPKDEQSFE